MSVIVNQEVLKSEKPASAVYCKTMIDLAKKNDKIVSIGADLDRSVGIAPFKDVFPERYFDVGIAEANMMGVAAGLSLRGMIPFTNSFAPFAVRRCLDQIYVSGASSRLNIKFIGANPGIMAVVTGGTHMPFDDIADCIAIPEMMVVEPSDNVQLEWVLHQLVETYGMCYLRFDRTNQLSFYAPDSEFELGKAVQVRDGKDVTIIATGAILLNEAVKAAALLKEEGIEARVLDMFTIKPLDVDAVIKAATETGAIVTAENSNQLAGLGSMVALVLAQQQCAPLECIGSGDQFGQVGLPPYLLEVYGMTAANIVSAARRAISRK